MGGGVNKTLFWPGTQIPKSTGNAFDLTACKGELAREFRMSQIKASCGLKGAQVSQMRTYSKAVPGEWLK
jgi:hypothetical protein